MTSGELYKQLSQYTDEELRRFIMLQWFIKSVGYRSAEWWLNYENN